jgi:hypothetical protein
MKKWSLEELESAISFIKEGKSYDEIGKKLNRTRTSVKNKLGNIGVRYKNFNSSFEFRKCLECKKEFETTKGNEKIFCNHSCSATYNNKKRVRKIKSKKNLKCLCCDNFFKIKNKNQKFCSNNCSSFYIRSEIFKKIELGENNLNSKNYKNYLIHKHGEKCMECGWCEKNIYSNKIPIELEHIDGNSENNELNNLKLLCPNCHSLTPTYKALNVGNGRHKRRERYKKGKSF